MSKKQKQPVLKKILSWIVIIIFIAAAVVYVLDMIKGAQQPADPGNTANTVEPENTADPGGNTVPENAAEPEPEPEPEGPVYYSKDVLKTLRNTGVFSSTAIEHIFLGTVNSSKKGSGYHYDMIEGSPGKIVEGTRSKPDKNGCYTADVTVNGYEKEHYSTFYPDEWTPQQVVDAIVAARKDALDNKRHKGSTYIGYYNGIEIDMYLDSKDRVVSAYPIYSKK